MDHSTSTAEGEPCMNVVFIRSGALAPTTKCTKPTIPHGRTGTKARRDDARQAEPMMLAAWSACLGALSGPRHSGVVTFPRVVRPRPRPRPRPRLCRVLRGVLRHSKQAQACDAQEAGCNTPGDLVTQALNTFLNIGGREVCKRENNE